MTNEGPRNRHARCGRVWLTLEGLDRHERLNAAAMAAMAAQVRAGRYLANERWRYGRGSSTTTAVSVGRSRA